MPPNDSRPIQASLGFFSTTQFCFALSRSQSSAQSAQMTLPSRRMNTSSFELLQLSQRKAISCCFVSISAGFILQPPLGYRIRLARRTTVTLCVRLGSRSMSDPLLMLGYMILKRRGDCPDLTLSRACFVKSSCRGNRQFSEFQWTLRGSSSANPKF
jgi:hypothetical protein